MGSQQEHESLGTVGELVGRDVSQCWVRDDPICWEFATDPVLKGFPDAPGPQASEVNREVERVEKEPVLE